MKVTFTCYDWPKWIGGPNSFMRKLLPRLRERGVDPEVLVLHSGSEGECALIGWLRAGGYRHRTTRMEMYTEDRVRWILEQLIADPPDAFVVNVSISAYFAARWAHEAGIPTVGVLHSGDDYYKGILEEFVFGDGPFRLSAMVCVSRVLEAEAASRANGVRVWRAPIGVPVPEQPAAPPGESLRLVYLGRFVEEAKRVRRVAEWFCKAAAAVPGVEAALLGDGPERPAVEAIVAREGRGLPVTVGRWFDGERLEEQVRDAHAVVLLSDYEGLPIAMLEGMACGLVPISTRVRSGIPEIVEDGVTGLLVDDEASFVDAVARLRSDPALWARLSRNAREKVRAGYSLDVMASAWMELFEALGVGRARTRAPVMPETIELPPLRQALAMDDSRRPGFAYRMAARVYRLARRTVQRGRALVQA